MEREILCVWRIQEEERQQRTTYLISRLSAIDTAGFFKGQWKENYYVCGAYKKKNDNNVRLPHKVSSEWKENSVAHTRLSAIDTAGFFKGVMEREILCVWRIQEE